MNTEIKANVTILNADVPPGNMVGYATDLRSVTQGQASFTMEFGHYGRTPASI